MKKYEISIINNAKENLKLSFVEYKPKIKSKSIKKRVKFKY